MNILYYIIYPNVEELRRGQIKEYKNNYNTIPTTTTIYVYIYSTKRQVAMVVWWSRVQAEKRMVLTFGRQRQRQ
jgi:hypothetical protein